MDNEPVAWEDVNCPGDFYRRKPDGVECRALVYAAPPADDEAVRLLQWARASANTSKELRAAIDAYLAKVGK